MKSAEKLLTGLLEEAADEIPGAAEKFFEILLESTVYAVRREDLAARPQKAAVIVGERDLSELPFQTVHYEGKETLPIFTESAFAEAWAEREVEVEACEFRKLLWQVGDENWLYLNPSQEVGKELTAWEIGLLRKGKDAIPELVSELMGHGDEEFTIRSEKDLFPALKRALLPVLEIYPELEEAFLVGMTEGDASVERPVLGLKYGKITEAKQLYLRAELERVSAETLDETQQIFIVEDLANKESNNWELFGDATPFYISQRAQVSKKSPFRQALSNFIRLFSPRRSSNRSPNGAK